MNPATKSAMKPGLIEASAHCLSLADPQEKCAAVYVLAGKVKEGSFQWDLDYPVNLITGARPSSAAGTGGSHGRASPSPGQR